MQKNYVRVIEIKINSDPYLAKIKRGLIYTDLLSIKYKRSKGEHEISI